MNRFRDLFRVAGDAHKKLQIAVFRRADYPVFRNHFYRATYLFAHLCQCSCKYTPDRQASRLCFDRHPALQTEPLTHILKGGP